MSLTLPWAPRALWPNGRVHWSAKSRAARRQRHDAAVLCNRLPWTDSPDARARVTLTFCAPTRTARFDLDGALASQKAALDAIAEAIGVDDSRFDLVLVRGEKGAEGASGGVRVEVEMLTADTWQSIGNVAAKLQQRLAKDAADARNKSGPSGVGSTDPALTKCALERRTQDGC